MGKYSPLKITGMQKGLVQQREEFILPNDAYPTLQNAYVWRERIRRKRGYELLGRLQRSITVTGTLVGGARTLRIAFGLETTATIVPGSINITDTVQGTVYTDPAMNGVLVATGGTGTDGTINYTTTVISITGGGADAFTGTFQYYPGLPVMGIRTEEKTNSANDQTIFFDQVYAYIYDQPTMAFKEFIPGTTWNKSNHPVSGTDFFWSTNYWVSDAVNFGTSNQKLFWITNNTGSAAANADPIRITDGFTWLDFSPPTYGQIDGPPLPALPNFLLQCLSFLPYRGRLVCFNTWEGPDYAGAVNFYNRIRWSTIGNPFIPFAAATPTTPATGSWRDDIRGQGGFLDIPTSEDIISVGFVRDNLVIYCERSTWQLRYTGRSIAPFQIERVNSELGGEGPFSAVQFDTSLVGIGDKGIVECDSYKSERIDIKIPDFVFGFQPGTVTNNAPFRVHGVRDFINRLAYWTIPLADSYDASIGNSFRLFPNQRLVYNYENDSWALFNDSLTALGTFQPLTSRTWKTTHAPWIRCDFPWIRSQPAEIPAIVGGNQQGFIEYIAQGQDEYTTNDVSLYISAVTPNVTTPTVITSPNHNMNTGFVIEISGIPIGTPYASSLNSPQAGIITNITQANPAQVTSANHALVTGDQILITGVTGMIEVNDFLFTITVVDANNFTLDGIDSTAFTPYSGPNTGTWTNQVPNVFGIVVLDADTFELWIYNSVSDQFSTPQLDPSIGAYIGGGLINIRENFTITSKKFNFLDEGQNIQMGYLDILMSATEANQPGAISLNVYLDYDNNLVSNTSPENQINSYSPVPNPDTFFNSTIPTTKSTLSEIQGEKFWQRVYCPTRANFLTLQYTFSNVQLAGEEQTKDVQIDAQILWLRKAGRMTQI